MAKKKDEIVLLKDLVIPAGTVFHSLEPWEKREYVSKHYECYVDMDKDLSPHLLVEEEVLEKCSDLFTKVK